MKKHKYRTIPVLLIICFSLLGLALAGCGAGSPDTAGKEELQGAEEQEVSEEQQASEDGKTGGSQEKFRRVIALSESNAELWLLAGGSLIATSDDAMDLERLGGDTVSLGDMDHVSLEAVAALEPDLLILFSTVPAQKALGEAAEEIGLNVYYTNIDNFADYDRVMKELTSYTGKPENYDRYAGEVKRQIDGILADVPDASSAGPDGNGAGSGTFLLLHVSATKSKAEKSDYFACEIFNDLGLSNIAADDSAFDELSVEAVAAADPEYIFVVPRGDEEKALQSFEELFAGQPVWESLSAVRNGNCHLLSKELFGLKPNDKWAEAYKEGYALLYGER